MSNVTSLLIQPLNSLEYVEALFTNLNKGNTVEQVTQLHSGEDVFNVASSKGWYTGPAYVPNHSDDIAQILYTSGTTGTPKAVNISHRALANTTHRLIEIMELTSEIKEYIGVPVNYSFGFGRCRAVSLAGGHFYLPEKFDPFEIAEMLKEDQINAISAVPSLWRVLLSAAALFPPEIGDKVRWIEIGSQYMSEAEKRQLADLFPKANIVQHYGLTEASRSTFLKIHERKALDSVGKPYFADVEIKVTSKGRIAIKGPHTASAIVSEESTKSYNHLADWFETTDLGEIIDGYLYFKGRDDDVINCGGVKLSPEMLEEDIFRQTGINMSDYAIFKFNDDLRGEMPAIAIVKSASQSLDIITGALNKALEYKKLELSSLLKTITVDEIPRTDTNKVKRKALTQYLEKNDAATEENLPQVSVEADDFEGIITQAFKDILKIETVSQEDSFKSLGGDSLATLMLMIQLEKRGLPKDEISWLLDGLTVKEVIDKKRQKENKEVSETDSQKATKHKAFLTKNENLALYVNRGLFVLINVLAHWTAGVFERLPQSLQGVNDHLAVLFNSGTTGFALIFGFSFGAHAVSLREQSIGSLKVAAIKNIKILFAGMLLLAILRLWSSTVTGSSLSALTVANSFYSVLYFYFFAVMTFPLLIYLTKKYTFFPVSAMTLFFAFWLISLLIKDAEIPPSNNPIVQLGVLLITAKYNYFGMMAIALAGAVVGYFLRTKEAQQPNVKKRLQVSGMFLIVALYLGTTLGELEYWFSWPTSTIYMSFIGLYLAVIVLLDTAILTLLSRGVQGVFVNIIKLAGALGLLAFPIFVLHELVLPAVRVFEGYGYSSIKYIPLLLFFAITGYMTKKVIKVV